MVNNKILSRNWKKPTAGIVLAAGLSERFRGTKQLARFKGKPLLAWVLNAALNSHLDRLVVVLGHDAGRILKALGPVTDHPHLHVVVHQRFREGLSQSLRAGLAAVQASYPSVMFLLGDQPLVNTALVNLLLARFWRSSKDICVPVCQGRRGNPVIFSRIYYERLQALKGDIGARRLIEADPDQVLSVAIENPLGFTDIDTRADLKRLGTT